jgi:hypothetical protein
MHEYVGWWVDVGDMAWEKYDVIEGWEPVYGRLCWCEAICG